MTAQEAIQSSKTFADLLIKNLTDMNMTPAARQAFFMDNFSKVQGTMAALKKITDAIRESEESVTDEQLQTANNAKSILDSIQNAIMIFQQEMTIDQNVQEEDLEQPSLTAENIQNAMADNSTTQKIVKDMNNIAKSQNMPMYTHCLMCDGTMNMFAANTKEEITQTINQIAAAGNYGNIELYKVTFSQVPVKKKMVLTI